MKYLFSTIILVLLSWQTTFAQATVDDLMTDSAKLYVEYADYRGYVNDSIYTSLRKTSLYLGKKGSVYIYQTRTPEEYLKSLRESVEDEKLKDGVVDGFKKNNDVEKKVSVVFAMYYSAADYLSLKSFDDGDVWLSDTAVFKWKPLNEFKTIGGYKCQKATSINSSGDVATAWFTEEIPLSAGPLYVAGLPGLVLEYSYPKSKYFVKATLITSTKIPAQNFRKWLSGPIVSKAEFNEMYARKLKDFRQFKRMVDSEKSTKQ